MKAFRVFLRALEPEDYTTTIAWRNDDEIWSKVVGRKYFVSREFERQWMERAVSERTEDVRLAICTADEGVHIGNVYLTNISFFERAAGSAVLIGDKNYWNRGHGTESVLLLLSYAFMDLGLERVEARQLSTNTASIRMHEKCGYQTEGVLRKAALKNGELVDVNLMSCLRNDFLRVWAAVQPTMTDRDRDYSTTVEEKRTQ